MSKETGLIPDSPFYAFIRRIRNLGTKAYNVFFPESPKSLSNEAGSSFPKDGETDQSIYFDFIDEIFRYNPPVIKTLQFDLNTSLNNLLGVGPNKIDVVELTPGGRLDGVVKTHNDAVHKGVSIDNHYNHKESKAVSTPFNFDNSGFKNKIREDAKTRRKKGKDTNEKENEIED